jgi:hypothetical protein
MVQKVTVMQLIEFNWRPHFHLLLEPTLPS